MSAEIAVIASSVPPAVLPDLDDAASEIANLITDGSHEVLNEVRLRAEAHAFYEKRQGHMERERHFAKLRLLAEAGLGVLSFDNHKLIPGANARGHYRALAAAYERGKLLDICSAGDLSTTVVVATIRSRGFTYVPGKAFGREGSLRWSDARKVAREQGVATSTLPPDPAYIRRVEERAREASWRQLRRQWAYERLERMKLRDSVKRMAREKGPRLDRGYGLLRQTVQALTDAQVELTKAERVSLDSAITSLHHAEDSVAAILGLRVEDY